MCMVHDGIIIIAPLGRRRSDRQVNLDFLLVNVRMIVLVLRESGVGGTLDLI